MSFSLAKNSITLAVDGNYVQAEYLPDAQVIEINSFHIENVNRFKEMIYPVLDKYKTKITVTPFILENYNTEALVTLNESLFGDLNHLHKVNIFSQGASDV